MPNHPGSIVMVDVDGSEKTVNVAEVPPNIAFARVGDAQIPVVRVVATATPGGRRIESYSAAGRLLSSTVQLSPRR